MSPNDIAIYLRLLNFLLGQSTTTFMYINEAEDKKQEIKSVLVELIYELY